MRTVVAVLTVALMLAGCGVVGTFVDGFKYAKAVESDVEQALGMRPQVGFQWTNGRLVVVQVAFPHLYEGKPLGEVAEIVRAAVLKEFSQKPEAITLAFSVPPTAPEAAARGLPEH